MKYKTIIQKLSYFSLESREKRRCLVLSKIKDHFCQLEPEELVACYISAKATYEHKKNVLSVILVTILLSGLGGVWTIVYDFLVRLIAIAIADENTTDGDVAFVSAMVVSIVFLAIIVVVLTAIAIYIFELRDTHKRLLVIEEVRKLKDI